MHPQEEQLLLGAVSAVVALMAAALAWFQKRHYADLDRKFEKLDAIASMHTEQLHQLALVLARSERVEKAVERLEAEIVKQRDAIYTLRPSPQSPPRPAPPPYPMRRS